MEKQKHELMTSAEVMDYLRISEATLRRWTREGLLTKVQIGAHTIRYRRADIEALGRKNGGNRQ